MRFVCSRVYFNPPKRSFLSIYGSLPLFAALIFTPSVSSPQSAAIQKGSGHRVTPANTSTCNFPVSRFQLETFRKHFWAEQNPVFPWFNYQTWRLNWHLERPITRLIKIFLSFPESAQNWVAYHSLCPTVYHYFSRRYSVSNGSKYFCFYGAEKLISDTETWL